MAGYNHPLYAQSFAEIGTPIRLSHCGGWILKRQIPGWPDCDGTGCYPIFSCQDWLQLERDLDEVGSTLISLAIVADPFGLHDPVHLAHCFRDVVFPFKEHFIVQLTANFDSAVNKHHRRNARKALHNIHVELCGKPSQFLDDWIELYANLIQRHQIKGLPAFSRRIFEQQFQVPGLVAFRAEHQGATVGMLLWYVDGDVGYYHLGAFSAKGYEVKASFGLFWRAIEYFAAENLRWLDLGGSAGTLTGSETGLSRFKRGWATQSRPVYFCGRIFDRARYCEIAQTAAFPTTHYFPAYRCGEFS